MAVRSQPGTSGRAPSSSRTSGTTASTSGRTGMAALLQRLELLGRRAHPAQRSRHPVQQVVGLVVAVVDELGVGGVQRDPGARRLPDPAGQPVVVRVDVRDHHALHVGDVGTRPLPCRTRSAPKASSVFQPASIR